ncbi:hypothetical protein KJI95_09210 [Shewanella sp. JM162201]|uniref:Lipoprotein n=1 Tax=Shewanella jiangmenensis TaxID=2837387 RepID=A0ABS5V2M7_9GAMM|nr:hypothetical protein [Shewanella jiangmenensis]MBT1444697.1 hypothetical protein [Shewanella jiangmenensis]
MALKHLPLLFSVLLLSACSANQASQFGCDFVSGSYENTKTNNDNSSQRSSSKSQDIAAGFISTMMNSAINVFTQEPSDGDCL